jgi:molecular chaperone GrpE (heat shock protein)
VVAEGLDRIIRLIEERQALDRFRENQVEKLHAELQGYKADLVSRAVRPVLQSLIRLHDDMGKVLQALGREDRAALTPEPLIGLLKGFQEDVELALDRNGVKSFRAEVEEFDPRRQTVVRTEKTDDPAQVGRLVERVRPGFEQAEVILEKERVAVYALSTRETQ